MNEKFDILKFGQLQALLVKYSQRFQGHSVYSACVKSNKALFICFSLVIERWIAPEQNETHRSYSFESVRALNLYSAPINRPALLECWGWKSAKKGKRKEITRQKTGRKKVVKRRSREKKPEESGES